MDGPPPDPFHLQTIKFKLFDLLTLLEFIKLEFEFKQLKYIYLKLHHLKRQREHFKEGDSDHKHSVCFQSKIFQCYKFCGNFNIKY